MDFYLSVISNWSFWSLEKAYDELKEELEKGTKIENPKKYLNGIVQRIIKERIGKL